LVPVLFFMGYEYWLLWAVYMTILTDYDGLKGMKHPKEDPVTAQSGQAVKLLFNCGTLYTNAFLLLSSTSITLYIGGVFTTEAFHAQV
jgi:hypothetical protein